LAERACAALFEIVAAIRFNERGPETIEQRNAEGSRFLNALEKSIRRVKSLLGLHSSSRVACALRPAYDALLNAFYGKSGLTRRVYGKETVQVLPGQRYAEEGYEPRVLEYVHRQLKPGAIVLDIGAHIGLTSILAARWCSPGGHVYAFEPTQKTRSVLEQHLSLNRVSETVTVVPLAVSDQCGTATFYSSDDNPEATLSTSHSRLPSNAAGQTVEVTTVDAFCDSRKLNPTLIKIDIEGFELHALRGARQTLSRCNPSLIIEFHPMNWPEIGFTKQSAMEEVAALGYRAVALEGQTDPYTQYGHVVLERSGSIGGGV
jgi:FkbM family methyltransferase